LKKKYEIAVLGVGSVGSSALYHASLNSDSVIGIDAGNPPHDFGSHSGDTRLIRQAYFEHPDYVPLLKEAYRLWEELEQSTGNKIFIKTGLLYMGPHNHNLIKGVKSAADRYGVKLTETVSPDKIFQHKEDCISLFEPNAGYLLTSHAISAHIDGALRNEADLIRNTEVMGFKKRGKNILVSTGSDDFLCEKLIICGGAGNSKLLSGTHPELEVTEQWLAWFKPQFYDLNFKNISCWGWVEEGSDDLFYGFPYQSADGYTIKNDGLKIAIHRKGKSTDFSSYKADKDWDNESAEDISASVKRIFKEDLGDVHVMKSCLYTYSRDTDFIVDFHNNDQSIVYAAGLSGHGFKFSSVLGKIMVDMLKTKDYNSEAHFLRKR